MPSKKAREISDLREQCQRILCAHSQRQALDLLAGLRRRHLSERARKWKAVANAVAGVILTYMRAFKSGDYIKVSDSVGTVVSSNLLVTRVLTPKNVEITVPNSSILGTHVINYSARAREKQLILNTTVTIGYDAPWRQVHALLKMAAAMTGAVLKDPAPFVLQNSLDDFYVTYELNAYTDDAVNMVYTYADLHKNIQDLFNE